MIPAALLLVLGIAGAVRPASGQAARASGPAYPGTYPWTRADVDFMAGMITHHAQAIIMANWAPTHGASKSVSILCARIVNAQTDEIKIFQQWEKERGLPVQEAKPMPTHMMMNGVDMTMLMPGMLTDEQMKILEASQGVDFDRNFLTFMIQHHGGAVTMVNQLNATPGAGQDNGVFTASSGIYADQTAEIERMQDMLSQFPTR